MILTLIIISILLLLKRVKYFLDFSINIIVLIWRHSQVIFPILKFDFYLTKNDLLSILSKIL